MIECPEVNIILETKPKIGIKHLSVLFALKSGEKGADSSSMRLETMIDLLFKFAKCLPDVNFSPSKKDLYRIIAELESLHYIQGTFSRERPTFKKYVLTSNGKSVIYQQIRFYQSFLIQFSSPLFPIIETYGEKRALTDYERYGALNIAEFIMQLNLNSIPEIGKTKIICAIATQWIIDQRVQPDSKMRVFAEQIEVDLQTLLKILVLVYRFLDSKKYPDLESIYLEKIAVEIGLSQEIVKDALSLIPKSKKLAESDAGIRASVILLWLNKKNQYLDKLTITQFVHLIGSTPDNIKGVLDEFRLLNE